MFYKDGRIYKGQWSNDQYHGTGILKTEPGQAMIVETRFEHSFVQPGHAKIQYPGGEIYEGKINAQIKREGLGKFYFTNGDKYEGSWKDDKRNGQGKLFFKNGTIFAGEFKDDEMYNGKLTD